MSQTIFMWGLYFGLIISLWFIIKLTDKVLELENQINNLKYPKRIVININGESYEFN